LIAPAVEKPVGKPTIVTTDDPRQTIQPTVNLKDFE